jgi:hypothetical protein
MCSIGRWVMRPASYRCIAMAIEIVVGLPAFFSR